MRSICALCAAGSLSFVLIGGAIGGCSSEPTPNYGPPGGLQGAQLEIPTQEAGPPPPPSDSGPRPDGMTGGGDACGAGTCAVSWTNQIFPNMMSAGQWKCTNSLCHGGVQAPHMTDNDPVGTYNSLVGFTATDATGRPVILPCSTDPAKSTIECNLSPTPPNCGLGAPMPVTTTGGTTLTAQQFAQLDTWVKCGAPLN